MTNMTKIQWTDKTANPVATAQPVNPKTGKPKKIHFCVKCSAGCKFCYAERMNRRLGGKSLYSKAGGYPKMALDIDMIQSWARMKKPKKIFVGSMTDIFGEWVPQWMIFALFDAMLQAPKQIFQLLTKRPESMAETTQSWLNTRPLLHDKMLDNIWLGTSIENQDVAQDRYRWLVHTPAAVRFLSLEPLLGPIDLGHPDGIDWIIVGGESGPNARPLDGDWILDILDQCRAANIPAFVKQLGSHWGKEAQACADSVRGRNLVLTSANKVKIDRKGGDPAEWPEHLRVRMFPGDVWE